jgi:hypothetical protein
MHDRRVKQVMIRGTCERERRGVGVNMVIYAFMKIEQ